jgi:rhamnosyl/mannosyltransferase
VRVLHIYRTYLPDPPGGLQEAIRQISLATSEYSVESRIFTLSPSPNPCELQFSEGKVIRSRSWMAPASCDIGGWEAVQQFLKLANWADIIHYHFP